MSKQYVQHISGQGEKWEVYEERDDQWAVNKQNGSFVSKHWLPKSEYRRCEPPERWVDVTVDCEANNRCALSLHHMGKVCTSGGEAYPAIYRLRKVHVDDVLWAFIVEQKVSE